MSKRVNKAQKEEALLQAQQGVPVPLICASLGISEATFRRWKRDPYLTPEKREKESGKIEESTNGAKKQKYIPKWAGLGVRKEQTLLELQDENRALRKIVAQLTLDRYNLAMSRNSGDSAPERVMAMSFDGRKEG